MGHKNSVAPVNGVVVSIPALTIVVSLTTAIGIVVVVIAVLLFGLTKTSNGETTWIGSAS